MKAKSSAIILILQHRDMLHFFDLVSHELIWSQKLEKEQNNRYLSRSFQLAPAPLGNVTTLIHRHHPSIAIRNIGMIAAANADYTCFYSRRKIVLIDTRTGKVRWTHENVDKETRVLGDDHMIYLVTRDRVIKKILRVSDGQQLELGNRKDDLKNAIYQGDSAFVLIASQDSPKLPGQNKEQISVSSFDPQSKDQNWRLDFPDDSQFGLLDYHYLSVLNSQGEIFIVDLQTGKKSTLEPIPQAEIKKTIQGKVVLVDFWALWCPMCLESFHHLSEWYLKYSEQGLVIITIDLDENNSDNRKFVTEYLTEQRAPFENFISTDGATQKAMRGFKIDGGALPHCQIYNRQGEHVISLGNVNPDQIYDEPSISAALEKQFSEK